MRALWRCLPPLLQLRPNFCCFPFTLFPRYPHDSGEACYWSSVCPPFCCPRSSSSWSCCQQSPRQYDPLILKDPTNNTWCLRCRDALRMILSCSCCDHPCTLHFPPVKPHLPHLLLSLPADSTRCWTRPRPSYLIHFAISWVWDSPPGRDWLFLERRTRSDHRCGIGGPRRM